MMFDGRFRPFSGLLADSLRTAEAEGSPAHAGDLRPRTIDGDPGGGGVAPHLARVCRLSRSPEGRCASRRDGPAAHPSPDLRQPAAGWLWEATSSVTPTAGLSGRLR